jgi:hypothetical protein
MALTHLGPGQPISQPIMERSQWLSMLTRQLHKNLRNLVGIGGQDADCA